MEKSTIRSGAGDRRLFEPFVVQIIAMLLDRFGDSSAFVRDANDQAAQTIMANLSSSGEGLHKAVKLLTTLRNIAYLNICHARLVAA